MGVKTCCSQKRNNGLPRALGAGIGDTSQSGE